MAEEETTIEKYDRLVHLHSEARVSRDALLEETRKMFPGFKNVPMYDDVLGDYELAIYTEARGYGQSVTNSAYAAEVSATLMRNALEGIGVSIERFVAIVRSELFARAGFVTSCLRTIERPASRPSEVSAAVTLLEKTDPKQFGKNAGYGVDEEKGVPATVSLNFTLVEDGEE